MRWQTPVAYHAFRPPSFGGMRASPGREYTEYTPAGTPHASAQNLTLGVGYHLH